MTEYVLHWAKIPVFLAIMKRCILKKWSARQTAERISRLAGYTVTRNALIGAARRRGMAFQSDMDGEYPRKPKKPRVRKPKQYVPSEPLIIQEFLGLSILDLPNNGCHYPNGDGPFLFCGQPKSAGSSYCPHHHQICYIGYSVFKKPGDRHEFYGSPRGHLSHGFGRAYRSHPGF